MNVHRLSARNVAEREFVNQENEWVFNSKWSVVYVSYIRWWRYCKNNFGMA